MECHLVERGIPFLRVTLKSLALFHSVDNCFELVTQPNPRHCKETEKMACALLVINSSVKFPCGHSLLNL